MSTANIDLGCSKIDNVNTKLDHMGDALAMQITQAKNEVIRWIILMGILQIVVAWVLLMLPDR